MPENNTVFIVEMHDISPEYVTQTTSLTNMKKKLCFVSLLDYRGEIT
jgi:hypothetical protein